MSVSQPLLHYFQNTPNLFVYKFGASLKVPSSLIFPLATTTTLINCTRDGVFQILTPHTFPAIQTIQYISANPGNPNIHRRFPDHVQWIFPDKHYPFYELVIQHKKGKRDATMIDRCLQNKRILDGESPFDITYEFDLVLPDVGVVPGEAYKHEFEAYVVQKIQELKDHELF